MRALIIVALVAPLLSGCLADDNSDAQSDGHFVYFRWSESVKQTQNGVSSYGQNAKPFSIELQCNANPVLSWDSKNWIHGSVSAVVLDNDGQEMASHTLSSNSAGFEPVPGAKGTWTLTGSTHNANGHMEFRLTC